METVTAPAADERALRLLPRALPIASAALAFGILAQLLFFGVGIGINVPIAVVALLTAAWLAGGPRVRRLRLAESWLPLAAITLAVPVALRGDRTLVALDVLGSLLLTAASVAAMGGFRVFARPLGGVLAMAVSGAGSVLGGGAAHVLGTASRELPSAPLRRGLGSWAPVARGILIAVPLVLLFMVLFSAADAVFAEWTQRLFRWNLDLGDAVWRIILAAVVAWFAAGLLAFPFRSDDERGEEELASAWSRRPRIGIIEMLVVLSALDLVFALFVVLQATYLFGGQDTLADTGLTYAEYARRGFFELLAVAFLVGGLVLVAEWFVRERTRPYRAGLIGLVVLTLVVLASAFLRLRLYQDAYGWTELRFYVLAAIFWLAIGTIVAIATIIVNRSGWLLHVMLGLSVVFGLAFNVIGPVQFVAQRNVDRLQSGERGDLDYVVTLGADAVPAFVQAVSGGSRPVPPQLLDEMAWASGLDNPGNEAWQAWNLSRENARGVLGR
jgi:hypothetical protein